MITDIPALSALGWSFFFSEQLNPDLPDNHVPARVVESQRTHLTIRHAEGSLDIPISGRWYSSNDKENPPVVGDWVVIDLLKEEILLRLDRWNTVQRTIKDSSKSQVIASNVDTLFLVTSCNTEFSMSRLTRYLALALDSRAEPVIVITKADISNDPQRFLQEAKTLKPNLAVRLVNALDIENLTDLSRWFVPGKTIGLLGSSGVGKSTLVNTLLGNDSQRTALIREKDGKGRHTTTHRSLHLNPHGGLIIDSPGMRELGIAQANVGVDEMFSDILIMAKDCRFFDCMHETEPDCAVRAAIAQGLLDEKRLDVYLALKS